MNLRSSCPSLRFLTHDMFVPGRKRRLLPALSETLHPWALRPFVQQKGNRLPPDRMACVKNGDFETTKLSILCLWQVFAQSVGEGIITSMVLFFIPFAAFHDAVDADGANLTDHKAFGVTVASILIVAVTIRVSEVT